MFRYPVSQAGCKNKDFIFSKKQIYKFLESIAPLCSTTPQTPIRYPQPEPSPFASLLAIFHLPNTNAHRLTAAKRFRIQRAFPQS